MFFGDKKNGRRPEKRRYPSQCFNDCLIHGDHEFVGPFPLVQNGRFGEETSGQIPANGFLIGLIKNFKPVVPEIGDRGFFFNVVVVRAMDMLNDKVNSPLFSFLWKNYPGNESILATETMSNWDRAIALFRVVSNA